ncbi:MAG TPA: hypothetical protein VH164_04615 [Ktedonobacteraceae bacterium]|nr:hypothetical protein [Ktedonobacteraceae bacterium]
MLKRDEGAMRQSKGETRNAAALNLKPVWQHTRNILTRLHCPEREAEVFLLSDPLLSCQIEFHRVVEDAISAIPKYIHRGYTLVIEPFHISAGKCAVIQDTCGTRICLFEKVRTSSYTQT